MQEFGLRLCSFARIITQLVLHGSHQAETELYEHSYLLQTIYWGTRFLEKPKRNLLKGILKVLSGITNWSPGNFFNFYATISREEHKTILSGLRISEMALSEFFLSPASHHIGFFCKSCEMA